MLPITLERFMVLEGKTPGRRCFALHPDIHESATGRFYFRPPFPESIRPVFEADTGLRLWQGNEPDNWYCYLRSEADQATVRQWVTAQGARVFLRDCLSCSIALDHNFIPNSDPQKFTPIGQLEHDAKQHQDKSSITKLMELYIEAIRSLPPYASASAITAVPAREGKPFDLPTVLAASIADQLGLEDITPLFQYAGDKGQLKETRYGERWEKLNEAQLGMRPEAAAKVSRKAIILVDDKYQSGVTANYVAMVLQQHGAARVCGLYAVKTWGDRDNS